MKKILSSAALTLLTGLLLAGCSAAPAASPEASTIKSPEVVSSDGTGFTPGPNQSIEPSPAATKPSNATNNQSSQMSRPDDSQKASLMAELEKIDPALNSTMALNGALRQCRLIQSDVPEDAQLSNAKQLLRGTKIESGAASEEAAKNIISVIKNNGFCKAAS